MTLRSHSQPRKYKRGLRRILAERPIGLRANRNVECDSGGMVDVKFAARFLVAGLNRAAAGALFILRQLGVPATRLGAGDGLGIDAVVALGQLRR